ncbi:LOW QUALITY PROTEIN: C-type lectin domain family 12 member B [Fukomys damarensis]|uniref:LOW QUALITY PROTEIN: C-type lectin domain family 12 member B n=1 Tax=Fukomys damarensis TaxID=885580 RepID=UPI00053FA0C4|nr:LOW QUALITY PROTEIN: C-type lectin domain family 12 member B [Fukomys damarensis]
MSHEVTYATLTFQDSSRARNNQDRNNLKKRGNPAPSPAWRQVALSLLTLCLLLLIGLVTLGVMLLQMSREMNSDSEKLSQLPKVIHHQQDNLSQQLDNNRTFSMEKEFLKSQVSKLLKRQEQLAVQLCRELITHTSDHKCKPCPKAWQWHGNSCYHFTVNEDKTWSNSRKDCRERNSTLAKIDDLREKDFIKSQPLAMTSFFWLGLSWLPSGRNWLWEDESVPSPSLFSNKELDQINGSKGCAYFQRGNIYVSRCSAEIPWICEKTATPVKIEDLD